MQRGRVRCIKHLPAIAAVGLIATVAQASLLGPGQYRGEYEIDRWGRARFNGYSVAPEAAAMLKPHRGESVVADVTEIDQKDGFGEVTILHIASVKPLTNSPNLELTISVPKSVDSDRPVPFVISFTNRSDAAVYLWPGWDQMYLLLAGGPKGQTSRESASPFQSFRFRTPELVAHGSEIEAAHESPGGPERVRILPGGSFRIELPTRRPLPPGEYQTWWRVYHTAGPRAAGHPSRSPRCSFDVEESSRSEK